MAWHDFAQNPEAVTSLYDVPPSLQGLQLQEITLHVDGPRLELRGDLTRFPDRPPARWVASGYNAVQLQLDLFGLQSVQLSGWSTENRVDITMEQTPGGLIALSAQGMNCNVVVTCQFFRIAHLRGYCRAAS